MALNFVCGGSKVSKKDGLTPLELYSQEPSWNSLITSSTSYYFNKPIKHLLPLECPLWKRLWKWLSCIT